MYKNRFGISALNGVSANTVFSKVATIGRSRLYFSSTTGTINSTAKNYILACFENYNVSSVSITGT